MATRDDSLSLAGISKRRHGRHAFVHERVLEIIVRETERAGAVSFSKSELAKRLGCCVASLDRAVTRLRREGYVVSTPVFDESGAQRGNTYRATEEGKKLVG